MSPISVSIFGNSDIGDSRWQFSDVQKNINSYPKMTFLKCPKMSYYLGKLLTIKYLEMKNLTGEIIFSNKLLSTISLYSTLISFKCRWVVIRKLKLCIKWIIIWYNLCQKISRNETILILKFIKKLMITRYTALKPHSYCKVILFFMSKSHLRNRSHFNSISSTDDIEWWANI